MQSLVDEFGVLTGKRGEAAIEPSKSFRLVQTWLEQDSTQSRRQRQGDNSGEDHSKSHRHRELLVKSTGNPA